MREVKFERGISLDNAIRDLISMAYHDRKPCACYFNGVRIRADGTDDHRDLKAKYLGDQSVLWRRY